MKLPSNLPPARDPDASESPPPTLEALLGPELGEKATGRMNASRLEQVVLRLEQGWRRWLAAEHGGRGPAVGTPDRSTLERTIPILRVMIQAKQALEKTEDLLAKQVRKQMQGRGAEMRSAHTAHGVMQANLAIYDLGMELPYPPSPAQVEDARRLVELRYRAAGFLPPGELYTWTEGAIPLVAVKDGKIVSTLSIIKDEGVLPLEQVFPAEVKKLREQGRPLLEVGAFATNPDTADKLQTQATMTLVDLAMEVLRRRDGSDLGLMAVHPHHAGFYARRLGAELLVSEPRPHPKVEGSPAVLLLVTRDRTKRQVAQEVELVAKIVAATLG